MEVAHCIEAYTSDGKPVLRFTVKNSLGVRMEFTNWGARWISAFVPDNHGHMGNVLAGYNSLTDYLDDPYYMGATVGRFANRIAGASFTIDGHTFQLESNDGTNTNHGGYSGFHCRVWNWEKLSDGIRFTLHSPDGEGGFPGNVFIVADYRLGEDNKLSIRHYAETDRATYVNLTNHAYFNLGGTGEKITHHWLQIPSTQILETTQDFIPTGRRIRVEETPFDFTFSHEIGERLYADSQLLRWNKGYNHCYILEDNTPGDEMRQAACLSEPVTGRTLIVDTDLPSVLLYTAGYYSRPDTAVCLETQFFPDTPSHPDFPSCLLNPGDVYEHFTTFTFTVDT